MKRVTVDRGFGMSRASYEVPVPMALRERRSGPVEMGTHGPSRQPITKPGTNKPAGAYHATLFQKI